MMPVYRSMDSHPYQRNQMAFPHYYQPGFEAIAPQMNVDPSKSTFSYEQPWPCAGSYMYPSPMQFCCGHHKFPGYCSYRPEYLHVPTPSPMYFSGGCPAYAEPFFVPYVPPPHYTMELPKYEYDKCMPRAYHCCGSSTVKEGQSVKIEEHEPDVEKKVNDAMVPIQLKNYPYPYVWIPPEYMGNRELKKPVAAEVGDQDKISHDKKPPEYVRADGQEPKVWNGWFPLYSNMIQDDNGRRNQIWQVDNAKREYEDGRINQNQQSENKRREFPFPIIWMPYYNMQDGGRTNNQESLSTPKSTQEVPHALKSVPVNSYAGDATNRTRDESNMGGSDVTGEVNNEKNITGEVNKEKSILVKQMELRQGKNDLEGTDRRVRNNPVKQTEGNMTDNESQISVKSQSTSPRKTSKLPPVCLRVDPLPRKKNGNGSSRSPSPPASKEHSQATSDGTSKAFTSSSMDDKVQPDLKLQNASNGCEEVKPKEKSIKVLEKNDEDQRGGSQSQITSNMPSGVYENSSASTVTKESWTNDEEDKIKENKAEGKVDSMIEEEARDSTKRTDDKRRKERKVLSDIEAAVLIQAAYRGFQVRKWEPLKKLKRMDEVSKHVTDVRDCIQALETSSDFRNDNSQRVTIGETIMRLLLKLDTIQGLHPSFREMRKSLARELTSLQEKLDSIMAKKSQQQVELSARKPVEDTPLISPNGEYIQEQPEEEVAAPGKDSSEGIFHESRDDIQDQLAMKDGIFNYEVEKSQSVIQSLPDYEDERKSSSPVDPVCNEEIEPLQNEMVNEDFSQVSTVDAFSGSGVSETNMAVENKTKSELEDIPIEVDDLDMKAWKELPQGVIDEEELADVDFMKSKQNEIAPAMMDGSEQDGVSSIIQEIAELPVGLLDDDTSASEFVKHDETGISKEVLQAGQGECNGPVKTSSSADEISNITQLNQQQLEERDDVNSTEESDGWAKIELQKDELKGDALLDTEVECQSGEINEQQPVTTEFQAVPSLAENDENEVADGDSCLEVKEVNNIQPEPVDFAMYPINDVTKAEATEEEVVLKEAQFESGDIVSEQAVDADAGNREALAEQKGEPSITSPVSKELPIPQHGGEMDGDKKLIQENEKLRKMMQKLLEAGNEQLTVISELTGKVKDLENKLARKKRGKAKHCRPAISKSSCKKSSNKPLQGRVVGVAM